MNRFFNTPQHTLNTKSHTLMGYGPTNFDCRHSLRRHYPCQVQRV